MSEVVIARASIAPYTIDFGAPLTMARGPLRFRSGWLVRLDAEDGTSGWGDAAPLPGFGSSPHAVASRLCDWLVGAVVGARFDSPDAIAGWLDRAAVEVEVRAAIELAMLDLLGRKRHRRIAALLDPSAAISARTYRLVDGGSRSLSNTRASAFKLKVRADLDEAERQLVRLRAAIGPASSIRLDAGGAWSEPLAHAALSRFSRYGIDLIEQPVAPGQLTMLAQLRIAAARQGVKIAVDEDVTDARSLAAIIRAAAADAVVIKPMFVGGLMAALRLARQAAASGLEAVITHALDSAIGRAGALQLAAAISGIHGLAWSPARDVADLPEPRGDAMPLPGGFGLGVTPRRGGWFAAPPQPRRRRCHAIPQPLASSAIARSHHPAVIVHSIVNNYEWLADRAARGASQLRRRGLHAGAKIALDGPPSQNWVAWFHAIGWLGAAVCPLPCRATSRERAAALAAFVPDAVIDASEPIDERIAPMRERWWRLGARRAVVLTSGTSGSPRAVELTTWQLMASAFCSALRLGHDRADRWLCALPLHHVAAVSILWRCALSATTVVLHDRFDPESVSSALDRDCTIASLTPTMLARLLDFRRDRRFPPHLRALLVGGGPVDDALAARSRRLGLPIAATWGMTEAASQIATREPGDCSETAAGLAPLAFARIGTERGCLTVRGPLVGGRLLTRDRGVVREGRVVVLGRADDVIVHGGENIDPREVEAALCAHPRVAEACVFGVPCPRYGQAVCAAVVPVHAGEPAYLGLDEVSEYCLKSLTRFKIPTRWLVLAALPRTALGKIATAPLVELACGADEAEALEPLQQVAWNARRLEALDVHKCVNMPSGRTEVVADRCAAAGCAQLEAESDGPLARTRDADADVEAVSVADGADEVGFGVDERHADPGGEQLVDRAAGGEQQLLVGIVGHLENAAKKEDPSPIDVMEAGGDPMDERHDHERS